MDRLVNIALPIPVRQLFTYKANANVGESLAGRRALVSFGRRTLTGVIVEEPEHTDLKSLKSITELLDTRAIISPEMLQLTKWIADYYFCSWGEALRAVIPSSLSAKSVLRARVAREITNDELRALKLRAPKRAALLEALIESGTWLSSKFLESRLRIDSVALILSYLETDGLAELDTSVEGLQDARKITAYRLSDEYLNENSIEIASFELAKKYPKRAKALSAFADVAGFGPKLILPNDIGEAAGIKPQMLKQLAADGYLAAEKVYSESTEDEGFRLSKRNEIELRLTKEQREAYEQIAEAVRSGQFSPYLLFGVTGSGKTLVYLHSIRSTLADGKSALVLVPEISLTPQLIDRFRNAFHERVAVLHSRMSPGERTKAFYEISTGEARIVIGARSAVFAPMQNLGLVIVDEEHEPTYKQDSPAPRYNARDTALMRGQIEKATVVLGSATPSIETFRNAETGKYRLLRIMHRADNAEMPRIKALDMISARREGRVVGTFSVDLLEAVSERTERGEGTIIFQNRRGFSSFLICSDCGDIPQCKNCSTSLTYHKATGTLACHYCGHTQNAYMSCGACGSKNIQEIGSGTERIEDELTEQLIARGQDPKIARLDLDTTRKKGSHRKILSDFFEEKTDILVGTQMVAKGLDFSRVTLVGVTNADLQLFTPDFRAGERTFQLLTQVAGRAGRSGNSRGEVIIQTSRPESPAIYHAITGDYEAFYHSEIPNRAKAQYPPFSRIVLIEFTGKDEDKVHDKCTKMMSLLPRSESSIRFYGPITPMLYMLRGYYRRLIVIKSIKENDKSGRKLKHYLDYAVSAYNEKYASSTEEYFIDVDSYSGAM